MARSPLIWFGGKGKVSNHIISRMPFHTCYVELFGGAAHVIAQKAPITNEVYNDIDGEVVNFLLMARNKPKLLREACESLPYSRMLYGKWKKEEAPQDDFERAVRFFYLNRSSIAKGNSDFVFSTDTGWRHGKDNNTARTYQSACQAIETFAERMKTVMIDNRDFRDVIRVYDSPTTLFYVDPPYIGREKYYALTNDDRENPEQLHRDLAEMMNRIQGKAIISYYEHPLLNELYPGWHKETFKATRQVVNRKNNLTDELLLMNFDDGQMNIFDLG